LAIDDLQTRAGGGQELTLTSKMAEAMAQRGFAASYQFPVGSLQ
jgi:hypothetical protein